MADSTNGAQPAAGQTPGKAETGKLSDEVFQQLVERVYAMLLADLRIEDERRRISGFPSTYRR